MFKGENFFGVREIKRFGCLLLLVKSNNLYICKYVYLTLCLYIKMWRLSFTNKSVCQLFTILCDNNSPTFQKNYHKLRLLLHIQTRTYTNTHTYEENNTPSY